jgi:hypothetical protein
MATTKEKPAEAPKPNTKPEPLFRHTTGAILPREALVATRTSPAGGLVRPPLTAAGLVWLHPVRWPVSRSSSDPCVRSPGRTLPFAGHSGLPTG